MTIENEPLVPAEEMNDFLNDEPTPEPPTEPAPVVEPPPAEPDVIAPAPAVAEPAPAVPPAEVTPLAAAVEPPVAPVPAAPPVVAKTPAQEQEELITALRTQINDLSSRVVAQPTEPAAQPVVPGAMPPASAPQAEAPALEFIKDNAAFDEVMKTPENFNRMLTGVVYKSVETVLKSVPQLVVRLADQQITTRSAINEFYTNNKDLIPSKPFVGVVANDLAAKHPDWDLPKLMAELPTEVRTRLKMATGAAPVQPAAPAPAPNGSPAFAGVGGSGKGAGDQRTSLQKDVDDLISD